MSIFHQIFRFKSTIFNLRDRAARIHVCLLAEQRTFSVGIVSSYNPQPYYRICIVETENGATYERKFWCFHSTLRIANSGRVRDDVSQPIRKRHWCEQDYD